MNGRPIAASETVPDQPARPRRVDLVLFDLDGTLVDSAPDLAGTANDLREAAGLAPLAYERLRPMVGTGARGMLEVAFGMAPDHPRFESLKAEFFDRYEARLLTATTVFEAVQPVLQTLDAHLQRWGIVTNKSLRFARPLARGLDLERRSAVLVGGDSTPHAKPHPEPLLEACRRAGVAPERAVYVGDDERDMVAARAAGMPALAAAWGYLGRGPGPQSWPADAILDQPAALLKWLELA